MHAYSPQVGHWWQMKETNPVKSSQVYLCEPVFIELTRSTEGLLLRTWVTLKQLPYLRMGDISQNLHSWSFSPSCRQLHQRAVPPSHIIINYLYNREGVWVSSFLRSMNLVMGNQNGLWEDGSGWSMALGYQKAMVPPDWPFLPVLHTLMLNHHSCSMSFHFNKENP